MDKQLEGFLEANRNALIEIYSKERESRGDGVLKVTKNVAENKVDVLFIEVGQLPKEVVEDIEKRKALTKKTNIIFFFVCNGDATTLLQIEIQR